MSKREKFLWILAYTVTAILTLLPFFQVGFTNGDDFQYYNTAQANWDYWKTDAAIYAQGAGRFYFLITKFFYYIPYLVDSFGWTKFVQYSTLIICYLLFSYLIYRIFKSRFLGGLTLLLLIFNTNMGYYTGFNPPTAYPFYFPFCIIIFICGILTFLNYTEKKGYWRVLLSALLFFISYLFYENFLVFTLLFGCYLFIRNWRKSGFAALWKSKSFYMEILLYVAAIVLYMACYVGYRYYLVHVVGVTSLYIGATVASHINMANFFTVLNNLTFYNLPGKVYTFGETKTLIVENSQLVCGHKNTVWFILTHAPALAYINALVQCAILWFLAKKAYLDRVSWKATIIGFFTALIYALSANILVAITEKYNSEWAEWMMVYVTSFFSYFGIMLAIALVITATLKIFRSPILQKVICGLWCVALFGFSLVNYYTYDHLGRAWGKSQNRVTMLHLIEKRGGFNKIPENALIYDEQLLHTSNHSFSICGETYNFEKYIMRCAHDKKFHFAQTTKELLQQAAKYPDAPIYFIQATESQKQGELMMVFSHISSLDTSNISLSTADMADVFYYSPTKDYVLLYGINAQTDSAKLKTSTVISCNKQRKVTWITLEENGLNPLGFSISHLGIPTNDTLLLP